VILIPQKDHQVLHAMVFLCIFSGKKIKTAAIFGKVLKFLGCTINNSSEKLWKCNNSGINGRFAGESGAFQWISAFSPGINTIDLLRWVILMDK
jgi:hypothetical protein